MKTVKNRKGGTYYIVLSLLAGALAFCGCVNGNVEKNEGSSSGSQAKSEEGENVYGLPKLDASIEAQIKQDWQKYLHNSPLLSVQYLGTYNSYVVFRALLETVNQIVTNFKIAGTIFKGTDLRFYLWKDGTFYYGLGESYLQGRLTAADISTIGEIRLKAIKETWDESVSSFDEWYEWYFNSDDIDVGQIIE